MVRDKFSEELKEELMISSNDEREETLQDYEVGIEAGKTEEEVVNSLRNST